jgi:hypothetical protein
MITIVSGSNRPGNNTQKIAKAYFQILNDLHVDCKLLSLETNTVHTRNADFERVEKEFLIPAEKFIFVFVLMYLNISNEFENLTKLRKIFIAFLTTINNYLTNEKWELNCWFEFCSL